MTRSKIRTSGAEGLTLSSTSLTVANGLTLSDGDIAFADGHNIWREDPDGTQEVAPAQLIPMLTKAVQELSAKNDALEARIKKLEDG